MNRSKQFILAAIPMAVAMVAAQPLVASAQSADLGRVTVTGSSIKRSDTAGPASVQVITRKEIERTGATSVNELLRSIPSIDLDDQSEQASNSASSGTASIKMRGLDATNTLVLLNGHRLPLNPVQDTSGAGASVDVNQIPISIIERVEVLKNGGSAIYGADAVAGVVNFITKKNYQGLQVSSNLGTSSRSDGTEKKLSITGGWGDSAESKINLMGSVEFLKRDPIYRKDREGSSSVNFERFGGGDNRSSFSPTGNLVDENTGAVVGFYKPCPVENQGVSGNGAPTCRYDFNKSVLTAYNGADRLAGLGVATVELLPSLTWSTQLTAAMSENTHMSHPVPAVFSVPSLTDPAESVFIRGRFMQGGPRITDRTSTTFGMVTGLEGQAWGQDWRFSLGRNKSRAWNKNSNYYDKSKWDPALASGLIDPTVSTNDFAVVESLKVNTRRDSEYTVDFTNLTVSGDVLTLPAGSVMYALGMAFSREALKDAPSDLLQRYDEADGDPLVVGDIVQSAGRGSRSARAVFGELSIPIVKNLDSQLALRHDNFGGISATTPMAGLKYTPVKNLAFRGSYSEGFRMPTLKQLYGGSETGADTISGSRCALIGKADDCEFLAYGSTVSNSKLKPENSRTYSLGMVYDMTDNVSLEVDLWKIKKDNSIEVETLDQSLQKRAATVRPSGYLVEQYVFNAGQREVSGMDFDARWRIPGTQVGTITLRNVGSLTMQNRLKYQGEPKWLNERGIYANPIWRNNFSATVDHGPWTWVGAIRIVGGFKDTNDNNPENQKVDQEGAKVQRVPSFHELDILAQYRGFQGWTLSAGIKNLTDAMPPFSQTNAGANGFSQMGFAEIYNNRGRFFYASVDYKFW